MESTRAQEDLKILIFLVGRGRYGIPLKWVSAVLEETAEEFREGRLRFRDRELPLVDLKERFGAGERQGKFPTLLVVGQGQGAAALRVDSTGGVLTAGSIRDWPTLCGDLVGEMFSGVIVQDDGLILVVDPAGICDAISGENGGSQGGARQ